jgi:hypothetical protein
MQVMRQFHQVPGALGLKQRGGLNLLLGFAYKDIE